MGLRYALLIVLYLFIFRIVVFIIRDLREASSPHKQPGVPGVKESGAATQGMYHNPPELVVLDSLSSSLPKGEVVKINKNITLGRESANDVRLEDSFASHEHARIFYHQGQYWLEDLGSTNGTFINGQRIKEATVLLSGDRLKIGGVTFQFMRWEHETQ